jgi:predicted phosphoribosyltransferase
MIFSNREEAGKILGAKIKEKGYVKDCIALGIPRGGVIVAKEVAKAINCKFDIIIPRKLRAPFNPELAFGAISSDDSLVIDKSLVSLLNISEEYIEQEKQTQLDEIKRRRIKYKKGKPFPDVKGKIVILVDDGIATGATMKAGVISIRKKEPEKVVVAVPVASPQSVEELREMADEIICLYAPAYFAAVGQFYMEFPQTSDDEVIEILESYVENKKNT